MADAIRVTTRVAVDPATAFEVFTRDIDLWWRRGPRFRWITAGERLVFEFRARSFEAGQRTEVEVVFAAEGEGTRVTVEHRGWEALAADHPARHGLEGGAFRNMMGVWWADLVDSARRFAEHQTRAGG